MCSYDHGRHGIHNLTRPEVIADPQIYLSAVTELGPMFYDEVGKMWVCSGYAEAAQILTDHRRFSSARSHKPEVLARRGLTKVAAAGAMLVEQMLFMDPPDQVDLRAAVRDQFSAARVRERDGLVREMAETVLESLPDDGLIDLIDDFAAKLHVALVGQLLGITDRPERLTRWADAYGRLIGSLSTLPNVRDREVIPVLDEAMITLREHARDRLANPRDDLISSLVAGINARPRPSNPDSTFDLDTVAANCVVFAAGGYETLTHLVSTGLVLLNRHPDQRRLLEADPELIDSAIDEFMRLDGSSQYLARQAIEDVEVGGTLIPAGQPVLVLLVAANRDPRKFTDPHRLDISRQEGRHLGFGLGRHYCIGAPYAERMARWAILGFLRRYPGYRIGSPRSSDGSDSLIWSPHVNTRCLAHAYVSVGSAAVAGPEEPTEPASAETGIAAKAAAEAAVEAAAEAAVEVAAGSNGTPDSAAGLLSEAERHQLLVEWNDTATPLGPLGCWHQLFEQRARLAPTAVAVEDQGVGHSYQDVDQRANALARTLRERGVEPETVVGIVMRRGVRLVVAMLAVAKAGGAFMLAEPACPPERLRVMLADASATVLLTDDRTAPELSAMHLQPLVVGGADTLPQPPVTGVNAGNTAYVVFTSGTTGRPKPIAISHESLINMHIAQRRVLNLGPSDRVLQFLSPNFDGCVFDTTMAVLCGAVLVTVPLAQLAVGPPLLRTLRDRRITVVTFTPSVWAALPHDELPDLRVAAAAGERLPAAIVRRWSRPGRRVLNLYGPAETAVWATWHECTNGVEEPPIGRPVPNKRVYVLDERHRLVRPGVTGELHIGGLGIGRYVGRPDLMEQRFRPDPFCGEAGRLMYRTGDLCRWRDDGTLEYLGRRDRQTKIRGQRVELDEVERVLETAPGVAMCSVAERDGRLEAIVVPDGTGWDQSAVRSHLAARLHSGMVPATFVLVGELPRTETGKVDRHVPPPAATPPVVEPPVAAPPPEVSLPVQRTGNGFERESGVTWRIAKFFASCLQLPQVEIKAESDFFSLGGDSLANAELLTAVEDEFGVMLDVDELLQEPTPAGIAACVLGRTPQGASA